VTYRGNPKLGGLKSGVGLLVDLGKPAAVGSVRLDLLGTGTSLKLLAAPGATTAPTSTQSLTTVGSATDAGQRVDLRLTKKVTTRWFVVWLTSLPSAPGGYQGRVAEISVRS
jgi:putative peptidoglycan lipid II flippase